MSKLVFYGGFALAACSAVVLAQTAADDGARARMAIVLGRYTISYIEYSDTGVAERDGSLSYSSEAWIVVARDLARKDGWLSETWFQDGNSTISIKSLSDSGTAFLYRSDACPEWVNPAKRLRGSTVCVVTGIDPLAPRSGFHSSVAWSFAPPAERWRDEAVSAESGFVRIIRTCGRFATEHLYRVVQADNARADSDCSSELVISALVYRENNEAVASVEVKETLSLPECVMPTKAVLTRWSKGTPKVTRLQLSYEPRTRAVTTPVVPPIHAVSDGRWTESASAAWDSPLWYVTPQRPTVARARFTELLSGRTPVVNKSLSEWVAAALLGMTCGGILAFGAYRRWPS